MREPLAAWLLERWEPAQRRGFRYDVRGTTLDSLEVIRADSIPDARPAPSILHVTVCDRRRIGAA